MSAKKRRARSNRADLVIIDDPIIAGAGPTPYALYGVDPTPYNQPVRLGGPGLTVAEMITRAVFRARSR